MDALGGRIDKLQIPVEVGASQFLPLAVSEDFIKERCQLRPVLGTVVLQKQHGFIVHRRGVFLGHFQDRKLQHVVQVILERAGAAVVANLDTADHLRDLSPQAIYIAVRICLCRLHRRDVHGDAAAFHDADKDRCRGFEVLHDPAMPRQIAVKPLIEPVIQA